jgi:2-(1,2-epoxy-1,2-dihydrophenyl)acetyl-CoA isomerase
MSSLPRGHLVSNKPDRPEADFITEIRGAIAYATVNRPAVRNAMTSEMFEQFTSFLDQIGNSREVRVLLLQATGKTFIAGGDVKAFAAGLEMTAQARAEDMRVRAERAGRICTAIRRVPQPVLVAARGHAVGAGLSILSAADLAIVADGTQFVLAHISLGLSPDGGASFFLPRQVGLKRAKQIALLGDAVSAQEALAMGLVNWVVPDAELEQRAEQLAQRLAATPAAAMAEIKALMGNSFERNLAGQLAAEVQSLHRCALTADYAEGLRATREKRKARFR